MNRNTKTKKHIKFLALLLIIALSASLFAGCGQKTETVESTGDDSEVNSYTADEPADDAPAAADAVTEEAPGTDEDIALEAPEGEVYSVEKSMAMDSAGAADRAAGDVAAVDGEPGTDDVIEGEPGDGDTDIEPDEPENDAEAGILTAGRWNDHENWGFFTNLVKNGTFEFPSYGVDPRNRFAVTVNDESGKALPNCKVSLMDSTGKTIWTSVTDKKGVAYLFYTADDKADHVEIIGANGTKESKEVNLPDVSSQVKKGDKKGGKKDPDKKSANDQGGSGNTVVDEELTVQLAETTSKIENMDIMFIMDATGSMGDEMTFLQKDFAKIAKDTYKAGMKFSVNFYRDEGDDYVTKIFDFTDDISKLQANINKQYADGGGDTPEAVHTILDESINKSSWRDNSVKLAFLIFDAPPHSGSKVKESIEKSVKKASEMGIRLIPVVSSNAERETEIFGRALAICTNSEYVFLTDDSGVGDSHLEPIVGDYEVKPLYDTIVEIIKEYKQ